MRDRINDGRPSAVATLNRARTAGRVNSGMGNRPAWVTALLCGALILLGAASRSAAQAREYLVQLNEPILSVSESNRSYRAFFDAYRALDESSRSYFTEASTHLKPGTPAYDDALARAGLPGSQIAVNILLTETGGFVPAQLELFGLPYGTSAVPAEMAQAGFVCSFQNDMLLTVRFEYLSAYEALLNLLKAEGHRRAAIGDTRGAIDSMLAMMWMARQLCDRLYFDEKQRGYELLTDGCIQLREFVWYYRDKFNITPDRIGDSPRWPGDLQKIAVELDRLDVARVILPRAPRLVGEQIIEKIFDDKLQPHPQRFTSVMADCESWKSPLRRFAATARWKQIQPTHASKREVLRALRESLDNWDLRWSWRIHEKFLASTTPEFDKLDDTIFAVVKYVIPDVDSLLESRMMLFCQINGTATAAGLLAHIKREGGTLQPGVPDVPELPESQRTHIYAPFQITQIQPSFVRSAKLLEDAYDENYGNLRYVVVKKRDPNVITEPFPIDTPWGKLDVPEGWPVLYSIGPDKTDHQAEQYAPDGQGGDIIFFPPIELLMGR